MLREISAGLCTAAIAANIAPAQSTQGNVLTGTAKVEIVTSYSGPQALPKPEKIFVQDFVPIGDVLMDNSAVARVHRRGLLHHGSDDDATSGAVVEQVQHSFSKVLIKELEKSGVVCAAMPDAEAAASGRALIIEGEFIGIDEGDMTKRIMVGFGRGASDVKAHVIVSLFADGHLTKVLEFNLNSQSGKKPGAIATMGAGSLAVGAVADDIGDKKATVQADASRMAKAVAKQIDAFMIAQKWVAVSSRSGGK